MTVMLSLGTLGGITEKLEPYKRTTSGYTSHALLNS